ncbi:MAG TPA: COX15/CtaA family protein [Bacteroidia bacterium]|jgi:cytochrome c oxidase assembly protein subunit 15|nr:COX15/CtaA family protein [Bacteroidia bacterium]
MQPSRRFLHLAQITLVFLYLVIIAGSVVRATGSGMGCPDWPKCFGHWIPPTDVSQLPSNYRDYFKVQQQSIAPFNAIQTWTEYGNRLVGAILGLLMFVQLIYSLTLRKTSPGLWRLSLASLVLTGMEGVLGAIVVYQNLKTGVITMHMSLSLIILCVQTFLVFKASGQKKIIPANPYMRNLILCAFLFTLMQILLGTQVRENVDVLLKNFDPGARKDVLDNTGPPFILHALFAWILLALNLFVLFRIWKDKVFFAGTRKLALALGIILVLEIMAGECLKLFALPAFVQPVHLLLASLLFGVQWTLWIRSGKTGNIALPI